MFYNLVISTIRTLAPIAAGAIITFFVTNGYSFDDGLQAQLANVLQAAMSGLYYILARSLESIHPNFGWLLLSPQEPKY